MCSCDYMWLFKIVGGFKKVDQAVLGDNEGNNKINRDDRDDDIENYRAADFEFFLFFPDRRCRPDVLISIQRYLLKDR